MANYKTRGIIIKRSNFGEADRLLNIFTHDKGKIRVLAKGARKQTSRLGGHLELFCLSNLVIAEGRNLDIITEAEIINPYINIRNELGKTNISHYLAEVIEGLTAENEVHEDIFILLEQTLNRLNGDHFEFILPYFEINFLKSIGYEPELTKCLKCLKTAIPDGNHFDLSEGGLVCGNCGSFFEKISEESIKVLRLFLREDMSILDRLKISKSVEQEIESIVRNYIAHIRQAEFKSRRFI